MGAVSRKLHGSQPPQEKPQGHQDRKLNPQQARALAKIQQEARAAGSFLTSGGKGGLDPSLVLAAMRRDKFRCRRDPLPGTPRGGCGQLGTKQNGGLGVHHLGGIAKTPKLSGMGHRNILANVVSCCQTCHNKWHVAARARGDDASQVLPRGDVGSDRDHGDKPVAAV
jgi:5-methylcytosine-specific restriction endonuclease McrA